MTKEGGVQPHNIAVLSSKAEYRVWETRIRSYLDDLDLLAHILDESQAFLKAGKDPVTEKEFTASTRAQWLRADRRTINKLIPLVSDEYLSALDKETAYEAWTTLREEIDGVEGDNVLRRLQEITNAKFDGHSGILSLKSHLTVAELTLSRGCTVHLSAWLEVDE
jgi:hypothetical protein